MELTREEITYLGPAFQKSSAISLFSNIKMPLKGNEHQSLMNKGIIVNGGYEPKTLKTLKALEQAERCSRLIVRSSFVNIEKYTYSYQNRLVLAENNMGTLAISEPEDLNSITLELSELFGLSKLKTTELSVSLPHQEMLVLLAAVDIYRKNALLAYSGQNITERGFFADDIAKELSSGYVNGLVKALATDFELKLPDNEAIGGILDRLVQKKCMARDKEYRLSENYTLMAKSFLIPNATILVETLELNGDEIIVAGNYFVTSGMHDVLAFFFEKEEIGLVTTTGSHMLLSIEEAMDCTLIGGTEQSPPPRPAGTNGAFGSSSVEWRCSCGRINKKNFCAGCGRKRS